MKLFKLSDNRYLNTSAIIEFSLDTRHATTDYLNIHLTDGRRMTLFSMTKGTYVEDAIKQNLITINKDTNEQSAHTTPTLR